MRATQGIRYLLSNCPRLTHLSLTGVQAFLRDDITIFCREAPVGTYIPSFIQSSPRAKGGKGGGGGDHLHF